MPPVIARARLVRTFREMAEIYGPSRRERAVADYVKTRLSPRYRVVEDGAARDIDGNSGNLLMRVPGRGEPILLAAHLDTVEPCEGVKVRRRGGFFVSDGTTILGADDRVAAAVLVELALAADKLPRRRPLEILFTVAEEVGLYGARFFDLTTTRSRAAFVLDASEPPGYAVVAAPSSVVFHAVFGGRAAHAGIEPEKGRSAVLMAAAAVLAMPLGRVDAETTANVGRVEGGRAVNIVPARAEVRGEARSHNRAKLEAQRLKMDRALKAAAARFGGKVSVEWERPYEGYRLAPDAGPVTMFRRAAKTAGLRVKLVAGGGGSDANVFNARGLPAVVCGCGMEKPHATEERLAEAALYRLADLVTALATE